jgi:Spy/CpxP family protein refolding chaperone
MSIAKALVIVSLATAIVASAPAVARAGGIGGGAFFGQPSTLHALDLTPGQTESVATILLAHRRMLRRLAHEEKAARRAIDDRLVGAGAVTPGELDVLVQHETETRDALTREQRATELAVRNTLTPEQIQKVASIRAALDANRVRRRLTVDRIARE